MIGHILGGAIAGACLISAALFGLGRAGRALLNLARRSTR